MTEESVAALRTELTDVRSRLGEVGVALGSDVEAPVLQAAQRYRVHICGGHTWKAVIVIALAVLGLVLSCLPTGKDFRARNVVERAVLGLLMLAASLAILTTAGIVLSMLFETMNFFRTAQLARFLFWREMGAELSRRQ